MNNQVNAISEQAAADLSEQLDRISKATDEFTKAMNDTKVAILKFTLAMAKLKEGECLAKRELAGFWTAWYYEREYRKAKFMRIKIERELRIC